MLLGKNLSKYSNPIKLTLNSVLNSHDLTMQFLELVRKNLLAAKISVKLSKIESKNNIGDTVAIGT